MKMLYIKNLSGRRMNSFALSAILAAKELGIDFTIASNMSMADKEHFAEVCRAYGIRMIHIDFARNPLGKNNLLAKKQLLDLLEKEKYDMVHCNTPTGGMIGRLCAAKAKIPGVIYMAHGFHFWKGAPLKNWLFYYPVERYLARLTDRLITINQEDYALAKTFRYKKSGHAVYVPGVGIDIGKYKKDPVCRSRKREELGFTDKDTVLLSVGEVNRNKNQKVVLEAIAKLNRKDICYLICGEGPMEPSLAQYAEVLGIREQVIFAGYRADVAEIYQAADVFVFPSLREGLSVALMEAMATGLPCVASRIRGNVDLLSDSVLLFEPKNAADLHTALIRAIDPENTEEEIKKNAETLQSFCMDEAVKTMKNVYADLIAQMDAAELAGV